MSWVIKNKETGKIIVEIFNKEVVAKINTEKYGAIPIRDYLANLNISISKGG